MTGVQQRKPVFFDVRRCLRGVCRRKGCRWYQRMPEPHRSRFGNCVERAARAGGLTLREVGEILGITRERVRQIEERALRKLFRALEGQQAKPAGVEEQRCCAQGGFLPKAGRAA